MSIFEASFDGLAFNQNSFDKQFFLSNSKEFIIEVEEKEKDKLISNNEKT